MPNAMTLKVGDWIKYVDRPLEWKSKRFRVNRWDIEFLDKLIARGRWQRISKIDEYGTPWIFVRLKYNNHYEHHTWAIFESSGWIMKSPQLGDATEPATGPALRQSFGRLDKIRR
ncbi:hypothetical protein LBMAG53_27600 [Planctomycetota bacterium]|nr:hypothetical protein LBMAG53_27600 [Planctomycetota bacterium]